MGTVVVAAVLVCVVGLIIKGMHKDKKNGRSSCGGDCSSCGGRCHSVNSTVSKVSAGAVEHIKIARVTNISDSIQKLKDNGCRITKQRLILLDIILEGNCNSCKEIYYKAAKKDSSIGTATVYRMINTLEDIGVISRRSIYEIAVDDKPLIKK